MFLNSRPLQYTPRAFYAVDKSLIDNDVNYYDFQKSKEYKDVYDRILSSEIQSMDVYVSPYFGQGNGAYRELDRVYEAYKSQIDLLDPNLIAADRAAEAAKDTVYGPTTASTINPMLILAVAAAAFFIGG